MNEHTERVEGELVPDERPKSNVVTLDLVKPRRLALSSLAQLRREMRLVYREARNKTLRADEASKLIWMLREQIKTIAEHEFHEQLRALEQRLAKGR